MMRFYPEVNLPGELFQELLLIQPVLEGLSAVYEHDRYLVGELPAQKLIGLHVHFAPAEPTSALELRQLLFDDLAQMTPLAGINDDFA